MRKICVGCVKHSWKFHREREIDAEGGGEKYKYNFNSYGRLCTNRKLVGGQKICWGDIAGEKSLLASKSQFTPINHNQFLFDFPSRQETVRIKNGEWFWNGRKLSPDWWTPVSGSKIAAPNSENIWVKAFGIPLHAWSIDTFRTIGNSCGGYVGIDDDTKNKSHLYWARICINDSISALPATIDLTVDDWCFEISILEDFSTKPHY
ncbi:hypothetical protein A4A49_41100 [Nicotiana attenuata]|uniref:Uncharacterized protein n=1 Tax=Nicotiana attenuata TaxID=49451 RepID=A0A1J6K9H7_NICAT|nr:hypothetical protein A4A49_41100 [Nicotiana attenuata]